MPRFTFTFVLALGVLFSAALSAEDKKDEKKPSKRQATAEGRVKSVEAKERTIILYRPYDPNSKDVIVTFSPDVTVFIDGKEGKFEDVPAGIDVTARVIGGKLDASRVIDATELIVIGKQAHGYVRKLSADSITYTPDVPPKAKAEKAKDVTIKLTADVKFMIGGKEAKLADIKVGEYVGVVYTADGKAVHIVARTQSPKKK
jgi:hypothetical protein